MVKKKTNEEDQKIRNELADAIEEGIMTIDEKINKVFKNSFGNTPLKLRLEDINNENTELQRWTSMKNLKEETGDLLASIIQLCNECGWNYQNVIQATLDKIQRRKEQYQSLGRKTRVALYGGSFNPIHDGHIGVAQFVLNTSKLFDEVWLVPCYQHVFGKKLDNEEHRIEMCKIAARIDGRIKVFDYEIQNKMNGEAISFVEKLLSDSEYTDHYTFSYIIGQDNANIFHTWKEYEKLKKWMRFVVVPRKGITPMGDAWYMQSPHIYLTNENTIPEISSTIIRNEIAKGNVPYGLDEQVWKYIQEKKIQF